MTSIPPFNVSIGPLQLTGYGIMMMAGFLFGGWLIDRELQRRGLRADYAADIVVAAVIGGVVGAKLWYLGITQDLGTLFSRSGLVWYGGLIGGFLAVIANGARLGVPLRWTAQLVGPSLAAAYALGRIGCFMVGDDYGTITSVPWGVQFPQGIPPTTAANLATFGVQIPPGTDPGALLTVHPTQLYEVAAMTLAFMVLWSLRTRPFGTGWLLGLYLIFAGSERFLVEFLRAKDDRLLGSFTLAQATSATLVLIGLWLLLTLKGAGVVEPGEYLRKGGKDGKGGKEKG